MEINEAFQLAVKHQQDGNSQQAENIFREIIRIHPNIAEAHCNLGFLLQYNGQLDEAVSCYQKALELNPNLVDAYYNLGVIFQGRWQLDEAITYFQIALQLNPSHAETYNNLGHAFQQKGLIDEAITCYERAVQLNPTHTAAFYNLGITLQDKGQFSEAMKCYEKALQLDPNFAEAHWNISQLNLLSGNFKEGWRGYEWRWKCEEHRRHNICEFTKPVWNGSDITGRTILLYGEQGFGDVIQFIRYAALVEQRGAKVIVECRKELKTLLQNAVGVHKVFERGEQLPEFDVYCPLLSLPFIFDTVYESIPATIPYIRVGSEFLQKWQSRVQFDNTKFKIGLAWAGSKGHLKDRYRSCPLELFAPLAQPDNVTLYSLQKGESTRAEIAAGSVNIIDYTEEIKDFSDTAAYIENLDLIITVDTAVAHLAGALGKPVWTLLPFVPDWRWMLNREDSPWYPTMRLFRQPSLADWKSVMAKVKDELLKLLGEN